MMKKAQNHCRGLAFAGVAVVALLVVAPRDAWALKLYSHTDGGGFTTVDAYDDDGELVYSSFYGPDDEYIGTMWYGEDGGWDFTNPNPAGDGSDGFTDDALDVLVDMIKDMASSGLEQEEIFQTLLVLGVLPDDLGPSIIDPFDGDVLALGGEEGGYGGYGGFDPNVPIGEQLPNSRGSDESEDDGDSNSDPAATDPGSYGMYYGLNPEIVNPVPAYSGR